MESTVEKAEKEETSEAVEAEAEYGWRRQVRLFVIGAMKGGTTSMHRYTMQHPQMVRNRQKELRCLSGGFNESDPYCESRYNITGLESNPDFVTGDFSPGYLWYFDLTINRIKDGFPFAKIIALFRNPVDRALSQHNMDVRNLLDIDGEVVDFNLTNRVVRDLEDLRHNGLLPFVRFQKQIKEHMTIADWHAASIDKNHFLDFHGSEEELRAWVQYRNMSQINKGIVSQGFYSLQIREWIRHFPPKKVLVLKTENMADEEGLENAMKRVYEHLELPYVPLQVTERANSGTYQQAMDTVLNSTLQKIFAPYSEHIEVLLGEDWKDPW